MKNCPSLPNRKIFLTVRFFPSVFDKNELKVLKNKTFSQYLHRFLLLNPFLQTDQDPV
jgi:hypothetical protein